MPPARLKARMDSLLSFPVGLFHPLQHAGLSRRSPSGRRSGRSKITNEVRMKYFLLAGFVFACTLAAQSNPGAASIEGHVLSSLTGAPIRKAIVVLTAPTSPI